MIKKIIFIFLILGILVKLYSHGNENCISEIFEDDVLTIFRDRDDNLRIEQSRIFNYEDLSGTFWVIEDPYIIENTKYFSQGYIFLNNNILIVVDISHGSMIDALEDLSLLPMLYISFINVAIIYSVTNGNIVINGEIFGYLDNSILYVNTRNVYRKYRLERRFSIYNFEDVEVLTN